MTTSPEFATLNVWLIHDWLTGMRGGEKVLLQLLRLFPNARIATLLHIPGTTHPDLDARVAQTSFLQKLPFAKKHYRHYVPLFAAAIRGIDLSTPCDLVISSSHAVAKNVRVPAGVPHVCYCHTPMRYIWGMQSQYVSRYSAKGLGLRAVSNYLRKADLRGSAGVTHFVANSSTVAERISRVYNREAAVVHPGIDPDYWTPGEVSSDFFLVVSAMVPYKRIDLAIEAARLTGHKLVIIGKGPEDRRLREQALGLANIEFRGWQSDDQIRDACRQCIALLFPGEEDFGLTPVETQACGRPVIAFAKGGVTETVTRDTGIFFSRQSAADMAAAMQEALRRPWDPAIIRENAMRFTWDIFQEGMKREIKTVLQRKNVLPA